MTSFPALARRVRDRDLALQDRLFALRECVSHFGPYGFRATWHHLVVSAGISQRLEDDPAALERAIAELEEARVLWTADRDAFAERRRHEKTLGRESVASNLVSDGLHEVGRAIDQHLAQGDVQLQLAPLHWRRCAGLAPVHTGPRSWNSAQMSITYRRLRWWSACGRAAAG